MTYKENAIEEEKDEYIDKWKRALADLENYRKGERLRLQEANQRTETMIIKNILPIIDNLERAQSTIKKKHKQDSVVQGFIQIGKQLKDFLKEYEIEEIEAEGEQFDPNLHEAVSEVESKEHESGEIVMVLEKGYLIKDTLLRPVRVQVAK